jgi:hypothetical protein
MTFKYAAEMASLACCPPSDVVPCDREVYRFVHKEIADTRNFMCVRKLSPTRKLKPEHRCSGLGLSLFVSEEKAIKRYKELKSYIPNLEKTLGNSLAAGIIKPDDGRMSLPSTNGHFDLWEAEGANLVDQFRIIADLA